MRHLLRFLNLEELIVHDVPKKLSQRVLREAPSIDVEQPIFSQVASPVNNEIINFFHDRIGSTIGSPYAFDVVFDPNSRSPVGTLMNDYFSCDDNNRRIGITQDIAMYLFDIQNAQNSSGLLLFIRCSIRNNIVLAILKVEREEGVRVRQQIGEDGLVTFDVEHIRDLMLTKRTKLFKIGLFYLDDGIIKGILCDQQRGTSNKDVADFFISDFLGCMLTEDPKIQTKQFFEITTQYINEKINNAQEKGALLNHLISELTNQNISISPTEFARRVLPFNYRDDYISFINENDVASSSFTKDISMIQNKLDRIHYQFSSGISVFGSREAINAKSTMNDMQNGETKMEIIDNLKLVKAK